MRRHHGLLPLRRWGSGPGTKVAVVGLGGLGHLAVKSARAMGAGVTVLSQSLKREDDALRLGASRCYATSDVETFGQLAGTFDLIVNTVSATVKVDAYLSLLAVEHVYVEAHGRSRNKRFCMRPIQPTDARRECRPP